MGEGELLEQKRDLVGRYFVGLSAAVFGGEAQDNGTNDCDTGAPDVINWDENQAYEIKATRRGDWAKISPSQYEHYVNLQNGTFPLDHPEVYYVFWSYQHPRKERLEIDTLNGVLSQAHKAALVISLDVLAAGIGIWPRSGSKGWPEYVALTGPTRRAFFKSPGTVVTGLGLTTADYRLGEKAFAARTHKGVGVTPFRVKYVANKNLNGLSALR